MGTLDEFLAIDGVAAAGEFGRDGAFIETAKAHFNELFQMPVGER